MTHSLTTEQRTELESAHRFARDKRSAYRINTLLLLGDGFSFEEIASILRLDDNTVRRYVEQYQEGGLKGLLETSFTGGVSKLSALQQGELAVFLDQSFCLSSHDNTLSAFGLGTTSDADPNQRAKRVNR